MHTLSTPHASHAASQCITCCTHMHQHMLSIDTHMHNYLTHALCLCISVLSCFCSVFKFIYHCFELTWVAFALLSFLFCVLICKCLRLKAWLWKEATTKGKSRWLMLMTLHRSKKELVFQQECMILPCSDLMLHSKPTQTSFEMLHCLLNGSLINTLS